MSPRVQVFFEVASGLTACIGTLVFAFSGAWSHAFISASATLGWFTCAFHHARADGIIP